ncbi:MAG: phosphoheptose isomerase [Magnetovibrio sp.]|nr:phosphoheptose isomerase [Magnetovibrio sp.]
MTFPDQNFDNIAAFSRAYFDQLNRAVATVDNTKLQEAALTLGSAFDQRASIYVCGNGGSAAISNHFICDHLKGVQTDTKVLPRIVSLVSNTETITAVANDISYDDVFVYQLATLAASGDVLVTISSSGDSENVVRAVQWAKGNGCKTICMTGFGGGRTAALADINLHVEGDNYGIVEDIHQSLMHILAQFLRLQWIDSDLIAEKKF